MTIELHTWNTPNGRKISVALEEMNLPYTVKTINISKGEQFAPAFVKISPNSKIPAIVDPNGPGGVPVSVFESGAILIYLGAKTGKFWPTDPRRQVPVLEWLMWPTSGIGVTASNDTQRKHDDSMACSIVGLRTSGSSAATFRLPISRSSAGRGGTNATRSIWQTFPT